MTAARRRTERVVFSLPRIKRETFVRQAELHRTIDSTNTRAMELAALESTKLPLLVLTENQTAGRGRGSNVWWSAPGALTFSLALDLSGNDTSPESWPRYALASAVAVCDALESFAPDASFGIRWPNDVCHGLQKICGILPELCMAQAPRLVLGVGINANNTTSAAPAELRDSATSLFDLTRRRSNVTALLIAVLRQLESRFNALAAADPALSRSWSTRCLLRDKTVRIAFDDIETEGRCAGIDADGALLLSTTSGQQRFYGGTLSYISVS
ncbi:MAG: biotin--[acetyl-CoA-carboxylase] ligase [Candidatus Hydrogenedentes bacterium]|nr:biotin--[acetyl-CoA-carboxylase] ligase [Candidatus Hydrogenedentota bacterium]